MALGLEVHNSEKDYAGAAYREAVRMRDEIMSFVGEVKLPV